MAKKCNFDSNISDFNSMDLEKAKNDFFMDLSYFAVNYSGKVIGCFKPTIMAAKTLEIVMNIRQKLRMSADFLQIVPILLLGVQD